MKPRGDCDPLGITLELAVPWRMAQIARFDPDFRDGLRRRWAAEAAVQVGTMGDSLIFGGKKPGRPADVFNRLAKGLAAAAYQPGGVSYAGRHWCVDHCVAARVPAQRRPGHDRLDPAETTAQIDAILDDLKEHL